MTGVLAIIPARGGSKSIRQKNVAMVCGRPLIAYTIDAAAKSARLTRTIVSSDDDTIIQVCRQLGAEVPFKRPEAISRDETPMIEVLQHALQHLDREESYRPSIVVLLQPTSPLRTSRHIDGAVDLLTAGSGDTVVSVVPVPHQFNPVSVMKIVEGRLESFLPGTPILRRQDKPAVYARNGPAVLASRAGVIAGGRLYGDIVLPYLMRSEESIDIDSRDDLALAEFLLTRPRP